MSVALIPRRKIQEWEADNPVLRDGEPGIEVLANRMKVGDGRSRWTELPYLNAIVPASVLEQINDSSPVLGLFADRPAPSDASWYLATNVNGGQLYASDGTAWSHAAPGVNEPAGLELGFARITSNHQATTLADIPGMTTTVEVGTRPIRIDVTVASWSNNQAGCGLLVAILVDGVRVQEFVDTHTTAGGLGSPGSFSARPFPAPAPGQHVVKLQASNMWAGTATINAASGSPMTMQVLTC